MAVCKVSTKDFTSLAVKCLLSADNGDTIIIISFD